MTWCSGKVFGIGLSRTGTTSLTVALSRLGLHAYHFPEDPYETILRVDAITDTPVADEFRGLDRRHRGSHFILTLREVRPWLDSCETFWTRFSGTWDEKTHEIHERLYGTREFDPNKFTLAYVRHRDAVRFHFRGRPQSLLEMNICGGDGWGILCPFLGLPVPEAPFPRRNAGESLDSDFLNDCPPMKHGGG